MLTLTCTIEGLLLLTLILCYYPKLQQTGLVTGMLLLFTQNFTSFLQSFWYQEFNTTFPNTELALAVVFWGWLALHNFSKQKLLWAISLWGLQILLLKDEYADYNSLFAGMVTGGMVLTSFEILLLCWPSSLSIFLPTLLLAVSLAGYLIADSAYFQIYPLLMLACYTPFITLVLDGRYRQAIDQSWNKLGQLWRRAK